MLLTAGAALLIIGIAVAASVSRSDDADPGEQTVPVVVARTDLAAGSFGDDLVTAGKVGIDQVPESEAPTDALSSTSDLAGKVLTDSKGMTLYTSNRDTAGSGKSNVTGNVLQAWPAYILTSGNPTKGDGVSGDATLITRDDGSKQVAYKGLPLYYWQNDKQPGDTTGNNVGGFTVAMP